MGNIYLKPAYKEIFHEDFSYDDFDKRLKMQTAVYLLQEIGAPVGDYAFFWYKHGPYSQDLQDDMFVSNQSNSDTHPITFSSDMTAAVNQVAQLMNRNVPYTPSQWAECLASLHYLQTNVYSPETKDNVIVEELMRRKPHLNDKKTNLDALKSVSKLCA